MEKHRPKIAVWSPLTPDVSSVSNYTTRLVEQLQHHADIDVYTNNHTDATHLTSANVRVFSYSSYRQPNNYQLHVYHMGNSQSYIEIYHQLLDHPGLLVLHDSSLLKFYEFLCSKTHNPKQALLKEINHAEGTEKRDQYQMSLRRRLASDPSDASEYPMVRSVIEASFAVMVHSPEWHHRLQDKYPNVPIFTHQQSITQPDAENAVEWGNIGHQYINIINLIIEQQMDYKLQSGVNLITNLRLHTGLNQAARAMAKSLKMKQIPLSYQEVDFGLLAEGQVPAPIPSLSNTDVGFINLIHINPPQLPEKIIETYGKEIFQNKYNIGYWFYELPDIPSEWLVGFDYIDELWVATDYVKTNFAAIADVPVHVIPTPVEISTDASNFISRAELGFPQDIFIFLFSFALVSSIARKYPLGLIEAFGQAFPDPTNSPLLVLKTHFTEHFPETYNALLKAAEGLNIQFVDKNLSTLEMHSLLNACDCYVSLHRAEGIGLGLAESMLLGKPVIGTNWSGNVDFMTEENSYLVNADIVPISIEHFKHQEVHATLYPPGSYWAQPDLDHAAKLMRHVYENQDEAYTKGAKAAKDIRLKYSNKTVGEIAYKRLQQIEYMAANRTNKYKATRIKSSPKGISYKASLSNTLQAAFNDWNQVRVSQDTFTDGHWLLRRFKAIGAVYRLLSRLGKLGHVWAVLSVFLQNTVHAINSHQIYINQHENDIATLQSRLKDLEEMLKQQLVDMKREIDITNQHNIELSAMLSRLGRHPDSEYDKLDISSTTESSVSHEKTDPNSKLN